LRNKNFATNSQNHHKIMLTVPTEEQKLGMVNAFMEDLESHTLVNENGESVPVVCSVCDGMPTCPQWHTFVDVKVFSKWCKHANLKKKTVKEKKMCPEELVDECSVDIVGLESCILSPRTFVNDQNEILVCKTCAESMEKNLAKKKKESKKCPRCAIANGCLTGNGPKEITNLNEVELSLISGARIMGRTWVFFAGCHRQIKGWHTFFKNRTEANVRDINLICQSGFQGKLLVVLCGPSASTQKALVWEATQVDPCKVTAAFEKCKQMNYLCQDFEIPHIDSIPAPIVLEEDVQAKMCTLFCDSSVNVKHISILSQFSTDN